MKKLLAIITLLCASCTVPVDQGSEKELITSSTSDGQGTLPVVRSGSSPCANGTPKIVVIDGVTYIKTVPLPCNNGWVDPSDPSPMKEKKNIIDPPPERNWVGVETQ